MTPPRVVLDTNCVLSALLFRTGRLVWLRDAWQTRRIKPLASHHTAAELLRVLKYPKFRLTAGEREDLLAEYLPWIESVDTTAAHTEVPNVRDPDDHAFLVLALAGDADALVTGDGDLLELAGSIARPAILTPAEFHERLVER